MLGIHKNFRHLPAITGLFVAVLIISNIAATKLVDVGWFTFTGATFLFPLSYIFGDVLTEVYGYAQSRKVIWTGFVSIILASAVLYIVQILPSAATWPNQAAYEAVLGTVPRIVLGSVVAYFIGEFSNSYILARMKVATNGRWLWARTIGSTIVGELLDTLVFISIAFYGVIPNTVLVTLFLSNYAFKTAVEIVFTPVTYAVTSWLKKVENEDFYDKDTDFNPFKIA